MRFLQLARRTAAVAIAAIERGQTGRESDLHRRDQERLLREVRARHIG